MDQAVRTIVGGDTAGEVDASGHSDERACLNCGTALVGSHCHACGQRAHVHRTVAAFFHDLLHGVFHFEGRIWRTLPLLAWHPGRVTREYIDGRRASYVSPIALFLFAVFVLFAVVHSILPEQISAELNPSVSDTIAKDTAELRDLQTKRAAAGSAARRADIDGEIAKTNEELETLGKLKAQGIDDVPGALRSAKINSTIGWLDSSLKKAQANPDLLIYKLQSSAYKYSWLLIPISVPFVWLLFPFSRRFGLYDHTVFVTYSLSFMTLLAVVLSVAGTLGVPFVALAALGIPPVHLYRHLRGTYALSRAGAAWRLMALLFVCSTACILFAFAILTLGFS